MGRYGYDRYIDEEDLDNLIKDLNDSDNDVRISAAANLSNVCISFGPKWSFILVEPFIKALNDTNTDVRVSAAIGLVNISDKRALYPLINALKDPDKSVRRFATIGLGNMKDKRAQDPLIEALNDSEDRVIREAASALYDMGAINPLIDSIKDIANNARERVGYKFLEIGEPAVEPLVEALNNPNKDVRAWAADTLGEIGDEKAAQPLLESFKDHEWSVRKSSAIALSRIGDKCSLKPLKEALNDKGKYVRIDAAIAFGLMGDKSSVKILIEALRDTDKSVRQQCAHALGVTGDKSAIRYLKELLDDPEEEVRKAAAAALGQIGELDPLIKTLKNPKDDLRRFAAMNLRNIGDKRSLESLLESLNDPDRIVRILVLQALGNISDEEVVAPLIERIDDYEVERYALDALTKVGKVAVLPLIGLLTDPNTNKRGEAASILGKIGDLRAVEPLINSLSDPNNFVRGNAARALGKIGDRRAVMPLINILDDNGFDVHSSALEGLKGIGEPAVRPLIEVIYSDENLRGYAVLALIEIGEPAVKHLIELLKSDVEQISNFGYNAIAKIGKSSVEPLIDVLADPDEDLRIDAISLLGEMRDERAVLPLIEALRDNVTIYAASDALIKTGKIAVEPLIEALNDPNEKVREFVALDLDIIGDKRAIKPLIQALNDPYIGVRRKAAEALGEFDDTIAVAPLIEVLKDSDKFVRVYAVGSLGKLSDARAIEPLKKLLQDPEENVRHDALIVLYNLGDPLAQYFIKTNYPIHRRLDYIFEDDVKEMTDVKDIEGLIISINEGNPEIRKMAISKLVESLAFYFLNEDAINASINLLDHPDPAISNDVEDCFKWTNFAANYAEMEEELIVKKLENAGHKKLAEYIIKTSSDFEELMKSKLESNRGKNHSEEDKILKNLIYSTNGSTRIRAARKLGKINGINSVLPLIKSLNDDISGVRKAAAEALEKIDDIPSINTLNVSILITELLNALNDPDKIVRKSAIIYLGKLNDPRAIGGLIGAMDDPDETVRIFAIETLQKKDLIDIINEIKEMENRNDIEGLIELLNDSNNSRRYIAAASLNKIFYPKARVIDEFTRQSNIRIIGQTRELISNCYDADMYEGFHDFSKIHLKDRIKLGHALWYLSGSERRSIADFLDDYYFDNSYFLVIPDRSGIKRTDFVDNTRKIEKMEEDQDIKSLLKLAVQWQDKSMSSIGGMAFYSALEICQPDISPLLIMLKDFDGKELVLAEMILLRLRVDTEPFKQFEKKNIHFLANYFLTKGFAQKDWEEGDYWEDPKDKIVKDIAQEIVNEAKKGDPYHGFYTPQSERIRSLTSKLIRENDTYMDDIISGLYGKK